MAPFSLISLTGPVCQWWFWILWVYEYAGVQPWWYPLEAFIWGTSPRLNLPANSLCHFQVFLCIEKSCIVTRKSVSESLSVCIVVELQSRLKNLYQNPCLSALLWSCSLDSKINFGLCIFRACLHELWSLNCGDSTRRWCLSLDFFLYCIGSWFLAFLFTHGAIRAK
jgi:hypothetical protein